MNDSDDFDKDDDSVTLPPTLEPVTVVDGNGNSFTIIVDTDDFMDTVV